MPDTNPVTTYLIPAPFQGADGQWYVHVRARNGRIVLQSEGYKERRSAEKLRRHLLAGAEFEAPRR